MKSFQFARKLSTASVTRAGRALGRTIDHHVRKGPAPSSLALSSSSLGRPMKNCRMKNTPKAPAAPGTTSAQIVSSQPIWSRMRKFGMRKMKLGMKRVRMIPAKMIFLKRNSMRAKA